MRIEYTYRWRIKWGRRWTTSHQCTEEQIRKEHPEAVKIEGSEIQREIPETPAEIEIRRLECCTQIATPAQHQQMRRALEALAAERQRDG